MKITYIHQHFRTPDQAGGTRSWEFARRLVADGHQVVVIAAGESSGRTRENGFTVHRIAVSYENSMSTTRRILSFLLFMVRSTTVAVRIPADVVVATSTPLTVVVPGVAASILQKANFILEIRDLWPAVPIKLGVLTSPGLKLVARLLERFAYQQAVKIIALSPGMRDGVLAIRPVATVVVIPNGCDFDTFAVDKQACAAARLSLAWGDEVVAVYAGSLGRSYNIEWVVRLAAHSNGVRFVILGDGASLADSRALAEKLGVDALTLLPGQVSKNDVADYYAGADVVVSSLKPELCLHDNSLNKVFDAMASSKPIIFNHDGWLSDLVVAHGGGWRLDDDSSGAARQLSMISRSQFRAAGSKNLTLGIERFSRDCLYELFRDTLADGLFPTDAGHPWSPNRVR